MSSKSALVVGVGPGLGGAVAKRFASDGFAVAMVARRASSMEATGEAIAKAGGRSIAIEADATDPSSVARAFARVEQEVGAPDVLVYNAGAFVPKPVADITPEEFEATWRANCFGGFLFARACVPSMIARGRGTILFTGATASLRGSANFACLAVGKFGLRALAQSMARELGPRGVHVAHVVVDGQIDTPRVRAMLPNRATETFLDPDAIARTYADLHAQDKTAWTFELDLRPSLERF